MRGGGCPPMASSLRGRGAVERFGVPGRAEARPVLDRALRLPHATAMGVGTIIGASIFVQPSEITVRVPSRGGDRAGLAGCGRAHAVRRAGVRGAGVHVRAQRRGIGLPGRGVLAAFWLPLGGFTCCAGAGTCSARTRSGGIRWFRPRSSGGVPGGGEPDRFGAVGGRVRAGARAGGLAGLSWLEGSGGCAGGRVRGLAP